MHNQRLSAQWEPDFQATDAASKLPHHQFATIIDSGRYKAGPHIDPEATNVAPNGLENGRLQAQPDPSLNQIHGPLTLSYSQAAQNGSLQAHANLPSKASNGAPKETEYHGAAPNVDNSMLGAQLNGAPKETEEHGADQRGKQRKTAFRNTVENFTPLWFVIPMNTGILGILMHQLPYQFNGLPVLSTIMYLVDLALFVVVCTMTILRWTLYPKAAQRKTAASIDEIAFLGAAPITLLTLASLTGLIVSNADWGGHAWSLVAYVMWWFGMMWMLTTCTKTSPPHSKLH